MKKNNRSPWSVQLDEHKVVQLAQNVVLQGSQKGKQQRPQKNLMGVVKPSPHRDTPPPASGMIWQFSLRVMMVISWLCLTILSVNHIYFQTANLVFPTTILGALGWWSAGVTLLYYSRNHLLSSLTVCLAAFLIGLYFGPFLEPPADTFEHLKRIHACAQEPSSTFLRANTGFWHYSMASIIIDFSESLKEFEWYFWRIHLAHSFFFTLLIGTLFLLSKSAGLTTRWAVLSCCIAVAFMGTNKIAYFTYYTLAPTTTSTLIYWFWINTYFFKRSSLAICGGLLSALMCVPILWVNHIQEVVYLLFILLIWLCINAYYLLKDRVDQVLESYRQSKAKKILALYCLLVFGLFFLLPQIPTFRDTLSLIFIKNLWGDNQELVNKWLGVYFGGLQLGHRLSDTAGAVTVALLVLLVPYCKFFPSLNREKGVKIYLLGLLPLIYYCVPLFHFVWVSNVLPREYYRLCYASIFWIGTAMLFQNIETKYLTPRPAPLPS